MLNKIMMTGRITTDLTVVAEDNYSYCKFSIAVDQPKHMGVDSIETYTFTCLAFDDNAKSVSFLYSKRWADNLCRLAQKRSRQDSSYYCGGTALPK